MIKKLFRNKKKGYVLILVALSIPVFLVAINYLITKTKVTHKTNLKTSTAHAIGSAILEKYDPAKTWDEQFSNVYTGAMLALNERAFELEKNVVVPTAHTVSLKTTKGENSDTNLVRMYTLFSSYGINNSLFKTNVTKNILINTDSLLCDKDPVKVVSLNEVAGILLYETYSKSSDNNKAFVEFDENREIMHISFDKTKEYIECECKHIGKNIKSYPEKCYVDLLIAIPTNHAACTKDNGNSCDLVAPSASSSLDTPIEEIASSCQDFLKNNFLRIEGVAVGVIPYSGKISLPPNRSGWTVKIPPMTNIPDKPYMKQIVAYGTDGGGEIGGGFLLESEMWGVTENRKSYKWGNEDPFLLTGFPIMYRCGTKEKWRGLDLYKGDILLSNDNPDLSNGYKFQRMNTNPCYLGHCNILSMVCEKACNTYMANPYFITELTDRVQDVIYDLNLIKPINDNHNKSNFLFLPLIWAMNLFSSWTYHPSLKSETGKWNHPSRKSKTNAVVIIVNAPDNFEPVELTYLGFNNDNSEIPMIESDTITFKNGGYSKKNSGDNKYYGTKGIIEYSTTGFPKTNSNYGLDYEKSGVATIKVPHAMNIRIVAEPRVRPSVIFYNDNGVTDNIKTKEGTDIHYVDVEKTFVFRGPEQIYNWSDAKIPFNKGYYTTKGPNFGHNLSIKKLRYKIENAKIKKASLSNQILRYYGKYDPSEISGKLLIRNDRPNCRGITTNAANEQLTDSCIYLQGIRGYNDIDGWTWGSGGSFINAYNFNPACYGLRKGSKFVVVAQNFPVNNLIRGNKALGVYSGNINAPILSGINITSDPDKYRVFDLNYDCSDNVCVFTGAIRRKTREKYNGTYVSQRTYSRSQYAVLIVDIQNDQSGNYTDWVYDDNDQLGARISFHCNNSLSLCACKKEDSECNGDYSIIGGGWKMEYQDVGFHTVNCANIVPGYFGCRGGYRFSRTPSCSSTFDTNGNMTKTECGREEKTEIKRFNTTVCYYRNYDTKGQYTIVNKDPGRNITWEQYPCSNSDCIQDVKHTYSLYNFFFINNNEVQYNSTAEVGDILANKCTGTINEGGNSWFCFCGDGTLSLTIASNSDKFVSFSKINNLYISDTDYVKEKKQYDINERINFYLTSDQLKIGNDGNYYFELNASADVRIISIEATNRPYVSVDPAVEMFSDYNKNKIDAENSVNIAQSKNGDSKKTLTFRTNEKSTFTVKAKVPYAWIDKSDYRQIEEKTSVYSNSNTHDFTVSITVPRSSRITRIGKNFTTIADDTCEISADRKLSSFSLNGKYDYVKEETWQRKYVSEEFFERATEFSLNAIARIEKDSSGFVSVTSETENNYHKLYAKVRFSCHADGGGCSSEGNCELVEWRSTGDEWRYNDKKFGFIKDAVSSSANGESSSNSSVKTVGCAGGISFLRSQYCSKTYDAFNNVTYSTSYDKDHNNQIINEVQNNGCSNESNGWKKLSLKYEYTTCLKKYNNKRYITSNTCEEKYTNKNLDKDYYHLTDRDVRCTDQYTSFFSNLKTYDWSGCFGDYKYKAQVPSSVYEIKLSDAVEIYKTGSFGNIVINCSETFDAVKNSGSLKAENPIPNYYSYSATATNCQIALTSRNTITGIVGKTTVSAQKMGYELKTDKNGDSMKEEAGQLVEISPTYYEFKPDGMGNYTVEIDCTNVVVSDPKMINTRKFISFGHPNLESDNVKNLIVIDGNTKPIKKYGTIGENVSTLSSYEAVGHLKYWVIRGSSENIFKLFSNDQEKNFGDFFAIVWDFDNDVPSLKWNLNKDADTKFYKDNYSFSGLHRAFFPYKIFGGIDAKFSNAGYGKMALLFAGFTLPLNYALYNNGYQETSGALSSTLKESPKEGIKKLSEDACSKLQNLSTGSSATKIYIVKYRTSNSTSLDHCGKQYSASSKEDLKEALYKIAVDIKHSAKAKDSYVTISETNKPK